MQITVNGTKVTLSASKIGFSQNNLVDELTALVDTTSDWSYKLDIIYPSGLTNIIDLPRVDNTCTVDLTATMLAESGKYKCQLRGLSGTKVYHTDIFDVWVKNSLNVTTARSPLSDEELQFEQEMLDLNQHPPKPNSGGEYWDLYNVKTKEYEISTIPLPTFEATVTSVNGKTGAVTLTYSDVNADQSGAASAVQTGIEAGTIVAGKATADASGNNIVDTYGTKTEVNAKYTKPATGIPSSDMASAVQTSLGKADDSVQGVQVAGTDLTKDASGKVNVPAATPNNGLGVVRAYSAYGFGIISNGIPGTGTRDISGYNSAANYLFVGKGTLENIKTDLFNRARLGNVKTTMDSVAVADSIYLLGTQTSVAITLPSSPSAGDNIQVVFYSGDTATSLTVSGDTIGTVPTPSTNQRIEMSILYDGVKWAILSNTMAVS